MRSTTELTIHPLGGTWHTVEHEIASSIGFINKSITVKTRFDGNGNSITRFVVEKNGKSVEYDKFDSAVGAFNLPIRFEEIEE